MERMRVLAVDDDQDILDLVQSHLQRAGIPSDGATSAEHALKMMEKNLYVVVVADIHMPGIGGVELISALKELSPLVQVIMLTGDTSMLQVVACADRGAVDFFSKSQNHSELVRSVREALERTDRWAGWMGQHHPDGAQPISAAGELA